MAEQQTGPGGDERLRSLEARLERLEGQAGVLETMYNYARAIDARAHDDWVACFEDDGIMDIHYPDPAKGRMAEGTLHDLGVRHVGSRQLHAFIADHSEPAPLRRHTVAGPTVEIDGDEARAESYMVVFGRDGDSGALQVTALGRYRDRLRRGPDGVWRFTERIAEVGSSLSHPR